MSRNFYASTIYLRKYNRGNMKGRAWKYKLNLAQLLRFRATFYTVNSP